VVLEVQVVLAGVSQVDIVSWQLDWECLSKDTGGSVASGLSGHSSNCSPTQLACGHMCLSGLQLSFQEDFY
jgi:hypothetical protein